MHPMFTYEERTRLDRLPGQHDHGMLRPLRPRRRLRMRMRIRHLPGWVLGLIRPRSRDIVIDLTDSGSLSSHPAPAPASASVAEAMIDAPPVDVARTTAAAGAPTIDM